MKIAILISYNSKVWIHLIQMNTKYLTLKSNKSPSPLQFSNHFIKLLNPHLSSSLPYLVNRSFHNANIPEYLKIDKQTPVFKGGVNTISNYRAITVVSTKVALNQ